MIAFTVVPSNRSLSNYADEVLKSLGIQKEKTIVARGEDIPFIIEQMSNNGKKVIGLTGSDLLREYKIANYNSGIKALETVVWSDKSALFGKPVLCLLGPEKNILDNPSGTVNVCINSKYKNLAKRYLNTLESKGFNFKKIYLSGSTESAYSNGLSDLVIDIVYTGASIKKANLKIYDKIFESDFVVVGADNFAGNAVKPRKAVLEMQEYKPPISGRSGFLRLDFNENTVGCSQNVVEALKNINPSDLSVYPEYSELRKKIAQYCRIKPEEVIPTNGTDEAIKTIIEAFIEKGKDEIVIPVPTYAMFKFYAQLNEAIIREAAYNEDLSFPTENVVKAISEKTKIVILVNPNNPIGTSIKDSDIIKITEKAAENNALVLIDEAYFQFYNKSSVPLINKYKNIFVIQTFSKAFGLAGLRLGYIISNKENIGLIQKALSPYSVNSLAVFCASAALDDLGYVKNYVGETKKSKFILYRELKNLRIKYYKSDANFILLNIGKQAAKFCDELRKKGILARNRSSDILLDGCVRITVGNFKQTKQLIGALREIIRDINPLLIFDIDGVLVDVSKSYRLAIKKTAEFFTKAKVSFEEVQACKNKGGFNNDWELTEAIIKSRGKIVGKQEIINKFQLYYNQFKKKEKWLLDKKILRLLSQRYNLAIFTGRPGDEAYFALKQNKSERYFKAVVSMEDVKNLKPNPEGLVKILDRFSCSTAFYFGDTVDDMKCALLAGIIPIGVLPPQVKSDSLLNLLAENGAKNVIKDINQIFEVLK